MADYSSEKDKTLKKYEDGLLAQAETQKAEVDTQLNQQINKAETDVTLQTKELERDYNDIIDANAIQKELDKRQIAETMANLGLSRSGLNATQQTAVELSAGNKNAEAMRQRQAAVDSLTRSLAEYKMEIENTRREKKNEIDANVQNSVAAYDKELTEKVIAAQQKDNEAVLDYDANMTKLRLEQAENSNKLINKAFRLASAVNETLEYFDTSTNSVVKITRNALVANLVAQEKMNKAAAEGLVDELFASFKQNPYSDKLNHNYNEARTLTGGKSTYDEVMLNAMTLPTTEEGYKNYNEKFGTEISSNKEARFDYSQRIFNSGLSIEQINEILASAGFSAEEVDQFMGYAEYLNNASKNENRNYTTWNNLGEKGWETWIKAAKKK